DDNNYSWDGDHNPLFGIVRLRRDFGRTYTLGSVLTTREDGNDFSRLAGADFRFYHSRLYFAQFQAAQSWTDSVGSNRKGSLLQADWDRTGRAWGFHYTLRGVERGFNAASGFINRTGIIEARIFNRLSFYGAKDALVQTYGSFFSFTRTWAYSSGRPLIETNESITPSATLRGGWQVGGVISHALFAYDQRLYNGLSVLRSTGSRIDTVAFAVPGPERDQWGGLIRATTPTTRFFSATGNVSWGSVPIFREAAPGRSLRTDAAVDFRPTTALRTSLQLSRLALTRVADGSRFSTETIPRLKTEYQVTPAIFLRLVGQYSARSRSPLRDRNGNPILVSGVMDTGSTTNEFAVDGLFSYRPIPGTLVYLGYGSTMEEPKGFRFQELTRTRDGFFGKVSYLFRY
ncbi:MAG: hypothetical protein ABI875_07235, partial [Gemmatimonadales bacterium]